MSSGHNYKSLSRVWKFGWSTVSPLPLVGLVCSSMLPPQCHPKTDHSRPINLSVDMLRISSQGSGMGGEGSGDSVAASGDVLSSPGFVLQ